MLLSFGASAVESTACGNATSSVGLDSLRELDNDSVDILTNDVHVVRTEKVETVTNEKWQNEGNCCKNSLKENETVFSLHFSNCLPPFSSKVIIRFSFNTDPCLFDVK